MDGIYHNNTASRTWNVLQNVLYFFKLCYLVCVAWCVYLLKIRKWNWYYLQLEIYIVKLGLRRRTLRLKIYYPHNEDQIREVKCIDQARVYHKIRFLYFKNFVQTSLLLLVHIICLRNWLNLNVLFCKNCVLNIKINV